MTLSVLEGLPENAYLVHVRVENEFEEVWELHPWGRKAIGYFGLIFCNEDLMFPVKFISKIKGFSLMLYNHTGEGG